MAKPNKEKDRPLSIIPDWARECARIFADGAERDVAYDEKVGAKFFVTPTPENARRSWLMMRQFHELPV